jgi:hypothetical protein
LTRATPRHGTCGTYLNFELLVGTVGTSVSWRPVDPRIRWIRWIWGWRIFHATVAKFGDPYRKSIPCAILIDTFDTGSRPPSSICQVRVVGGRYGQIDCKGEMIEDASACDHYDHGFYMILPYSTIKQPLGIIEYWIVFDDIWWYLMIFDVLIVCCCELLPFKTRMWLTLGSWTAMNSTKINQLDQFFQDAPRSPATLGQHGVVWTAPGGAWRWGRHGKTWGDYKVVRCDKRCY